MFNDPPANQYDPAKTLTLSALLFVGFLIVFVAAIIGAQIWRFGEANTESWAALTGLIGWVTGQLGGVFSARFGTTQQSASKDETIKVLSQTAAVATDTAAASASEAKS